MSDAAAPGRRAITASMSRAPEPLAEADPLPSSQALPGGPATSAPHTITAAASSPPSGTAAAVLPSAAVPPSSPDAIPAGMSRPLVAAPVVPVPPAAPPAKTAARYAAAEQLLLSNPAAARAELSAFVLAAPTAPEAAPALLDLARLAAAAGDAVAARAALDQLAAYPGAASYAMPAAYLRCTLEQTDPQWRACLASFHAAFPGSSRDADVLAHLAIATARADDCQAALPLLLEFRRRYPNGPSDAEVRSWTARCAHATTLP
jgi:TolA-binding protein